MGVVRGGRGRWGGWIRHRRRFADGFRGGGGEMGEVFLGTGGLWLFEVWLPLLWFLWV